MASDPGSTRHATTAATVVERLREAFHSRIYGDLASDAVIEISRLRSLLVEADSEISHMLYRRSWATDESEVKALIGRIRKEAR